MIEELISHLKPRVENIEILRGLADEIACGRFHQFQLARLRLERARNFLAGRRLRVAATACWGFPIYSQTFVYQELMQLAVHGFDLRFLYSRLNPRDHLPDQFRRLWTAKRKLVLHPSVYECDYSWFVNKSPEKVEGLVEILCRASGLSAQELRGQYHFKQAFSFARMVQAFRPDYLHTYFFYEGTLFGLAASYLLGIPRGVSCYADHLLSDYVLKVVPLHLEQCSVVVATSHRIKQELMAIAPHVDPDKIIVKPNAINAERFPAILREERVSGEPYRLVCVNRIEPKKGLIYLVSAMRLLRDRDVNVHLHVLGGVDRSSASVEYAEKVKEQIQDLDVMDVVHLEGQKNEAEIRRFLEEAELFIAPFIETESGDKDGIPTALLEAMATGLPAVATDAGSITEVIRNGEDGVVTPQRDPVALADAIQCLLLDRARRQRLGEQAAIRIRRHFDVHVCERPFHERICRVVNDLTADPTQ